MRNRRSNDARCSGKFNGKKKGEGKREGHRAIRAMRLLGPWGCWGHEAVGAKE